AKDLAENLDAPQHGSWRVVPGRWRQSIAVAVARQLIPPYRRGQTGCESDPMNGLAKQARMPSPSTFVRLARSCASMAIVALLSGVSCDGTASPGGATGLDASP